MPGVTKGDIQSLLQKGQFGEAKKLAQTLCKKNKKDAEAWFLLGSLHGHSGETKQAIDCLLRSISIQGNVAATHFNLGLLYLQQNKPAEAINSLQHGLQLQPVNPEIHFQLGNLFSEAKDYEQAITHFRAAAQQRPDAIEPIANLGNMLLQSGATEDAIETYKKALELQKDSADVLFNLGNAYRAAGDLDTAEASYHKALKINPAMVAAINNLGITLTEKGSLKEAEACHLRSISLQEDQVDAYINLASCYRYQRQPAQAIDTLRKALVLHPQRPELHWDLSLLLLATGKFSEGWSEYEWRNTGETLQLREFPYPEWCGESIQNSNILVTAEQGIGDEIMFASCFSDLLKKSGHVVIECEPRLAPLFSRSFPGASVQAAKQDSDLSWLSAIQTPDVHVSAGSLPLHLRQSSDKFPKHQGYLVADQEETQHWLKRYAPLGTTPKIGISWKGGHVSQQKRRSSSLLEWEPVLNIPGVVFINLQYGDTLSERELVREKLGVTIHHWQESDPLVDMDSFAAQISALDLVISVDNSTVHLSGSLGKATWVLQPYAADWRWMTPSRDSYWYPSVTQYYQPETRDWSSTLREIADKLKHLQEA